MYIINSLHKKTFLKNINYFIYIYYYFNNNNIIKINKNYILNKKIAHIILNV